MDASNGGTWDVLNPATEEVVRTVPYGTGAEGLEEYLETKLVAIGGVQP
jgi:hypothetical protein